MIMIPKGRRYAYNMIHLDLKQCQKCEGLNIPKVTMYAPAHGDLDAPVMLLGQSLHAYNPETKVQIPFVGPSDTHDSGDLLKEVVNSAGLEFKDLFITNVVHCHPPGNRKSTLAEIENCKTFLEREILLCRPELIICLGADAKKSLVGNYVQLWETWDIEIGNFKTKVMPIYHPSYVLRYANRSVKSRYFRKLREELEKWYKK